MPRIDLLQAWFRLCDPGMEGALFEWASMRQFARVSLLEATPDETTILNFAPLMRKHVLALEIPAWVSAHPSRKGLYLKRGTLVHATFIPAPASPRNASGERDPGMHQIKKVNQWYFGVTVKAYIGADAGSALAPTVLTTPASKSDVVQVNCQLHGKEAAVQADAKARAEAAREELGNAQIRARIEHPFRAVKCWFNCANTPCKGLARNTSSQIETLFVVADLCLAPGCCSRHKGQYVRCSDDAYKRAPDFARCAFERSRDLNSQHEAQLVGVFRLTCSAFLNFYQWAPVLPLSCRNNEGIRVASVVKPPLHATTWLGLTTPRARGPRVSRMVTRGSTG